MDFRGWYVDRFINGPQFDQPAIPRGLSDLNSHRIGGLLLYPEIDRICQPCVDRGTTTDQRTELVAAHFALQMNGALAVNRLSAGHVRRLNRGPKDCRDSGPGKQQGEIEAGIRGGLAKLARERVALKRAFGDPHTCNLQDRSALAGDLDVARNSVRRRVGTSCGGKGDARFFIEVRGRALTRDRELGALQPEDGVGCAVQTFLWRAIASSSLRLNGPAGQRRGTEQGTQRKNRECVFHVIATIFSWPSISSCPCPLSSPCPSQFRYPRWRPSS